MSGPLLDSLYGNIAVIAACALIAAVGTRLLLLGFKRNHLGFVLIFMFAFPVTVVTAYKVAIPQILNFRTIMEARRLLREDRYLSLLSRRDPNIGYRLGNMMLEIVREGFHGEAAQLVAFRRSQPLTLQIVESRVPAASDAAVKRYARATIRVVRELRGQPRDPCYAFLVGRTTESTLGRAGQYSLSDLRDAMVDILVSSEGQAPEELTSEEIEHLQAQLMQRLYERLGDRILPYGDILDNPNRSDLNPDLYCLVMLECYIEALILPGSSSASMLRVLMTQ